MPEARHKRVTLYDVAQQSGVSYQTVSRVINNHPHVSPDTRARVVKAIADLDYRPNRAAQRLATRRSQTLEMISFGTRYYGPAQMVASIERAAKAQGYDLIFTNVDHLTTAVVQAVIDDVNDKLVDGIVMITPVDDVSCQELADLCKGIPFVLIDAEFGANTHSVVIDQHYGSQLATEYLLKLGHRQICEISGPLNWFGAQARHDSWRDTLEAAGVEPGESVRGDWTPASGHRAARQLLDAGTDFTALIVGNDQMALGAMRALREAGRYVPEDVSVVGFDDVPEAAYFEPPLTTIRQDFNALGALSVDYLLRLIEQPDLQPQQRVLQPDLVERLSTQIVHR